MFKKWLYKGEWGKGRKKLKSSVDRRKESRKRGNDLRTKDELFRKQARKLQATLPIRNYESLTYLLTDGGEV